MEKLKYFGLVLMVALCAGFVSCSDDDDDENGGSNGMVGVWQGEEVNYDYYNGELVETRINEERIDVKDDGTYVFYEKEDGEWEEGEVGTWVLSDGKFIIYEDGDTEYPVVFTVVDQRTIVSEESESYSYSGDVYTYKEVTTLYKQ
ncbi:MAG: lipocalin family protein [Muribaculaceae bacterium]|nr:lipocalin family protein [Muribaculaceae bacterium]